MDGQSLSTIISRWLFGQFPLHFTTRVLADGHWRLVDNCGLRAPPDVGLMTVYVNVQALLFPVPSTATICGGLSCLAYLPTVRRNGLLEVARVFHENCLSLCVRMRTLTLILRQGDIRVLLQWSRLHALAALKPLCADPFLWPFDLPAWTWAGAQTIEIPVDMRSQACSLHMDIPFTSAGEV